MLRFDPFSDLDAVTRGLLTSQTGSNRTPRFMPMDLCKLDDHYVLTADLPGVDPGSVDVDVDNGTLTISAHRTARCDESVQWLTNERFFGSYRRQLSLGEGIDTSRDLGDLRERRADRDDPAGRARQATQDRDRTLGAPEVDHPTTVDAELVGGHRGCGQIAESARYRDLPQSRRSGVAVQPEFQIVPHRRPFDVQDRVHHGVAPRTVGQQLVAAQHAVQFCAQPLDRGPAGLKLK